MNKKEIIKFYMDMEVLISPDLINDLDLIQIPINSDFLIINKDVLNFIKNQININSDVFMNDLFFKEKQMLDKNQNINNNFENKNTELKSNGVEEKNIGIYEYASININSININSNNVFFNKENINNENKVPEKSKLNENLSAKTYFSNKEKFLEEHRIKIIKDYYEKPRKRNVVDFINNLNARFKELEKILKMRQDLNNLISIRKINEKKDKENVSFIGIVYEKVVSKLNNIILTVEDSSGFLKVLIKNDSNDLYKTAEEIQLDEVIGISGVFDKGLVYANNIFFPDIPTTKELKKSSEEGFIVLITDLQIGSKLFLDKEFNKFLAWISGEMGNEQQREIASKVKYLFLVGDLVEGIGVYPDQEYDLNIFDIKSQYALLAEYMKKIPSHIPILICPGNHDVGRISEPQPKLSDEYSEPLWSLPNVVSLSNPSLVNIFSNKEDGFPGFDVLLYHGYSFVYYAYNVPSIRKKGNQKRPDLISKYLLQRRHLAPTFSSTLFVPDPKKDFLTIDVVPDFFFSGHIHRASVSNYKNVTCINASCWVAKSEEQERRGLEPQPGRAFVINMQTREVKIMNFLSKEDQDKEENKETIQKTEIFQKLEGV